MFIVQHAIYLCGAYPAVVAYFFRVDAWFAVILANEDRAQFVLRAYVLKVCGVFEFIDETRFGGKSELLLAAASYGLFHGFTHARM